MDEGRTRSGRRNFVSCDLSHVQVRVAPQKFSAGAHSTQKWVPFIKDISVRTAAMTPAHLVLRSRGDPLRSASSNANGTKVVLMFMLGKYLEMDPWLHRC